MWKRSLSGGCTMFQRLNVTVPPLCSLVLEIPASMTWYSSLLLHWISSHFQWLVNEPTQMGAGNEQANSSWILRQTDKRHRQTGRHGNMQMARYGTNYSKLQRTQWYDAHCTSVSFQSMYASSSESIHIPNANSCVSATTVQAMAFRYKTEDATAMTPRTTKSLQCSVKVYIMNDY